MDRIRENCPPTDGPLATLASRAREPFLMDSSETDHGPGMVRMEIKRKKDVKNQVGETKEKQTQAVITHP